MLRWTCRLRDAFEARGFLSSDTDSLVLSQITEAEFVVDPAIGFPREFRWEAFCSCFKPVPYDSNYVTLVYPSADAMEGRQDLVLAMNTPRQTRSSPRAMNGKTINDLGQRNIDILWLSPKVFISGVKFRINNQIHDYEVTFGEIRCFITQLQAFDQVEFDEPSPLPVDFFQHLAPSEQEYMLSLDRGSAHPKLFPADYMIRLMSALPARCISFGGLINVDELRVLLAFPFHPNGILSFTESPFDDSVSLDTFMELLKTAPYLHYLILPRQFFLYEATTVALLEFTVESPALSTTYRYCGGSPTPALLNGISKIHQARDKTDFYLEVGRLWESENVALVTSVVHPFLDGRLTLEHLRIRVTDRNMDDRPDPITIHQVMQEIASAMISCRSRHLCHFNVALTFFSGDDDDIEEDDDDGVDSCESVAEQFIHRIRQWDEEIFPQLVLNCCSKRLTKALDGRLLPRAISAINGGILYRKTTDHIPYDMSTANAGLIFRHIKTDAVKSEQY
jgi:hypothetical protein